MRSYRADFRARRAALLGVNSSSLSAVASSPPSSSAAAAWLLGPDPDGEGEPHNFLFPFLRTGGVESPTDTHTEL